MFITGDPYRDLQNIFLVPTDMLEPGSFDEQFDANINIYNALNKALKGEADLEEILDIIEENVLYDDMDWYLDEVERDLGVWANNWSDNGMIYLPQNSSLIQIIEW